MLKIPRHFVQLIHDRRGIASVELALCVPLLALLLLGGIEVTRYILVVQKLEKVAVTLSDVATQSDTLSTTELDQIVQAAGQVMQPYNFGPDGYVIISSVTKNEGSNPVVNWQYTSSGSSGSWTQSSQIGTAGSAATLPPDFDMDDSENVIISEVFYNFEPIFGANIFSGNVTVYKTGFFRPRLGSLTTLTMLQLIPRGYYYTSTYAPWLPAQPGHYKGAFL